MDHSKNYSFIRYTEMVEKDKQTQPGKHTLTHLRLG